MSKEWDKSETNTGILYYINHKTERTQWDHPDLIRYLRRLERMNNIRFAAYRTAMKLRTLQKLLHLDLVDLSVVNSAFEQHGFRYHNDTVMDAVQLYNIIYEIYFLIKSRGRNTLDVNVCSELLLNWILNLYDTNRTGCLRVLSVKIGIAVMCAGRVTDKYRYLFQQVTDRAGGVSRKNMTALLQDTMQFADVIGEAEAFGKNVNAAVNSCFETVLGSMVTKERYMAWLMAEPQTIVWLPTMHRLAAAETMKHEAKCNICKMHPIIGLRYKCLKCLNYDLCQDCFFTGRTSKTHKYTHPTQEYCLGASSKEDVRAFAKTIRNKLIKKHGRRIKQKYLPVYGSEWDANTPKRTSVQEVDTHIKMGQLSKRLAAVESMQPDYVDLPMSATTPDPDYRPEDSNADEDDLMELENLIDQLEQENEDLLNDMEHLNDQRSRLPRHLRNRLSGSSGDEDGGAAGGRQRDTGRTGHSIEGNSMHQHQQDEMMKARYDVLKENNQQLEKQLQDLKEMMRKKYLSRQLQGSPSAPHFGHSGAPPPYHSLHRSFGQNSINPMDRTTPASLRYQDSTMNTHDGKHDRPASKMLHQPSSDFHQSPASIDMIDSRQAGLSWDSYGLSQGAGYNQAPPYELSLGATPDVRGGSTPMSSSAMIDRNRLLPTYSGDQSTAGHNGFTRSPDQAPPYELSFAATPDARGVSQSMTTSAMIGRDKLLPPYLADQSQGTTPAARVTDQTMATSALIDRNMLLPAHLADQSSFRFPDVGVSRVYPTEEEELEDLMLKLDEAYPVNFTYDSQSSPCQPSPSNHDDMQLPPPDPRGRRGGHPRDMLTAAARVGQAMSSLVSRVAAADAV